MENLTLEEKIIKFVHVIDGYVSSYGSIYSSGDGDGYGFDSGDGYGSGCKIKSIVINQQLYNSYIIDNINTFVRHIDLERGILLGFILNLDNTITECVVIKENNKFAHGKDLREAIESLQEKLYDGSTETERIAKFKEHFQNFYQKYPNSELFMWHHILTGSCKFGRNEFVKSHNINLDGSMNIYEFIELTKSSYGENTIKKLLL